MRGSVMPLVARLSLDDAGDEPLRPRRVAGVLRELRADRALLVPGAHELQGDAADPDDARPDRLAGSQRDAEDGSQLAEVERVAHPPVGAVHDQAADVREDP